jgi:hypothetical protein
MRFLDKLCAPAYLYAFFLAINLGLDLADQAFITAAAKAVGGAFGIWFIDLLCRLDLGIISWVLVAMPFIITSLATSIAIGIDLDREVLKKVNKA